MFLGLSRNQIIFYVCVAIVTFINMMAYPFGLANCTLAPTLVALWWVGYYGFPWPTPPKPKNHQSLL